MSWGGGDIAVTLAFDVDGECLQTGRLKWMFSEPRGQKKTSVGKQRECKMTGWIGKRKRKGVIKYGGGQVLTDDKPKQLQKMKEDLSD